MLNLVLLYCQRCLQKHNNIKSGQKWIENNHNRRNKTCASPKIKVLEKNYTKNDCFDLKIIEWKFIISKTNRKEAVVAVVVVAVDAAVVLSSDTKYLHEWIIKFKYNYRQPPWRPKKWPLMTSVCCSDVIYLVKVQYGILKWHRRTRR